jgi:hypothetical protein
MTNDNRTLTDSINHICEIYKQDPNCLTKHDLNNLETLMRDANWLLSESWRGTMNSVRHHQVFDRIHALLRNLEKKCADYHYQKKWHDAMLRQEKYNPNHKPAGSPEGGEFDFAPGGGGGSGNPGGSSPSGDNDTVGGYRVYNPSPDKFPGRDVVDKPLSKPLNVDKAIDVLHSQVNPGNAPLKNCARNVRLALKEGGITVTPPPPPPGKDKPVAKDYGLPLGAAGFQSVTTNNSGTYPPIGYSPKKGDVVVIQSAPGHDAGHMAMYDGKQWVSDFIQHDFWPGSGYRTERPSYTIYRHSSPK